MKSIASTANVMKMVTLLQIPQSWEGERYLPCHLAVFANPRERSPDSGLEAKRDSSSSDTAVILPLQREGLTIMGLSHQRVCLSLEELDQSSTTNPETFMLSVLLVGHKKVLSLYDFLPLNAENWRPGFNGDSQLIQNGQSAHPSSRSGNQSLL